MFDPKAKSTNKLIEKYKVLFDCAIQQHDNTLSLDQIKAIGKLLSWVRVQGLVWLLALVMVWESRFQA